MSERSEMFGFPQEDGQEPDFDAIFGGGESTEAPPIPAEEPKTTESADIPAADVPTAEPNSDESAASAKETAKPEAPKTIQKAGSKTREPEAEPDLFSAFNDQSDTPETPVRSTEAAPAGTGQTSLFDKAPVFSYGSAKEPIEDASITFEELRIRPCLKNADMPKWRSFSVIRRQFSVEYTKYSCEKLSCLTKKSLALGHIAHFSNKA